MFGCGYASTVVVLQQAAQSLLAADSAIAGTHPLLSRWKQENIFFTLMIPLRKIMLGEIRYRLPQCRLPEQNQSGQTFLFYRPHPSFRERVQIWTPRWQLQRLHTTSLHHLSERFAKL